MHKFISSVILKLKLTVNRNVYSYFHISAAASTTVIRFRSVLIMEELIAVVLVRKKESGKYLLIEGANNLLELPSKAISPHVDVCTAAQVLLEEVYKADVHLLCARTSMRTAIRSSLHIIHHAFWLQVVCVNAKLRSILRVVQQTAAPGATSGGKLFVVLLAEEGSKAKLVSLSAPQVTCQWLSSAELKQQKGSVNLLALTIISHFEAKCQNFPLELLETLDSSGMRRPRRQSSVSLDRQMLEEAGYKQQGEVMGGSPRLRHTPKGYPPHVWGTSVMYMYLALWNVLLYG